MLQEILRSCADPVRSHLTGKLSQILPNKKLIEDSLKFHYWLLVITGLHRQISHHVTFSVYHIEFCVTSYSLEHIAGLDEFNDTSFGEIGQ